MSDIGVIDRFVETFSQYIDSGFGLAGCRCPFPDGRSDRHRYYAGRSLLGHGA